MVVVNSPQSEQTEQRWRAQTALHVERSRKPPAVGRSRIHAADFVFVVGLRVFLPSARLTRYKWKPSNQTHAGRDLKALT
jgi:hypothetical protein